MSVKFSKFGFQGISIDYDSLGDDAYKQQQEQVAELLYHALNTKTLVAMVGSGVSVPLKYPNWRNFTLQMLAKLEEQKKEQETLLRKQLGDAGRDAAGVESSVKQLLDKVEPGIRQLEIYLNPVLFQETDFPDWNTLLSQLKELGAAHPLYKALELHESIKTDTSLRDRLNKAILQVNPGIWHRRVFASKAKDLSGENLKLYRDDKFKRRVKKPKAKSGIDSKDNQRLKRILLQDAFPGMFKKHSSKDNLPEYFTDQVLLGDIEHLFKKLFDDDDNETQQTGKKKFRAAFFETFKEPYDKATISNLRKEATNVYQWLVQLPIRRFITTNYDFELERALIDAGKISENDLLGWAIEDNEGKLEMVLI